MKKKILLIVPAESASGGIKNYFKVIKNRFTLPVEYINRGARNWPYRENFFLELKRIISDYTEFSNKINTGEYAIVQTSTSLGWASVIRDGIYLLIARKKGVKTIVFYRGWDEKFERWIEKWGHSLLKKSLLKADASIVLSEKFKNKLIFWGYNKPVFIETTLFDESLVDKTDIYRHLTEKFSFADQKEFRILFLARIEKQKGIYEALNSYVIIKRKNPESNISISIAGTGTESENVKKFIEENNIKDVRLLGHIEGKAKAEAFLNADCYLFPTYTEGMPNSILEAMAFGVPIITRSVGAIPEVVGNESGFHTNSFSPNIFANFMQILLENEIRRKEMSIFNFNYAKEKFYSESVLKRIEAIYKKVYDGTAYPGT